MPKELSNCCEAEVKAITSAEGTGFYQCTKCQKSCDIKRKLDIEKIEQYANELNEMEQE